MQFAVSKRPIVIICHCEARSLHTCSSLSCSQVDHSPSVHSALCNRVVDELNWRKTLRTTVCSLVAEDHPSSAFGQVPWRGL